jgi:hypothetical protein
MRRTGTSIDADDAPDHTDGGLRIELTLVGRRRSTSGLILAAAIATALGLALAKPWAPTPAVVAPHASAVAAAATAHAAASVAGPVARASGATDPTGIETAIRPVRVGDWTRLVAGSGDLAGQPIVTDRDLAGIDATGTCGGSARITPFDELFAIVEGSGETVARVRLYPIDSIRRADIPTHIETDRPGPLDGRSMDGLTVVGLPPGGIAAHRYGLVADTTSAAGPERRTYTICVG